MPTGYTNFIETGKVKNPKEFLHLCLRAFGLLYFLRDEEFKVQDDYIQDITDYYDKNIRYHEKEMNSAQKRLKDFQEMSESKLKKFYIEINQERSESLGNLKDTYDKNLETYLQYLKTIQNWDCTAEFIPIKDFAVEQIKISMNNDDWIDDELEKSRKSMEEMFQEEKEEFRKKLVEDAQWDINYHTEEIKSLQKKKAESLEYYRRFKDELEKLNN